MLHRICGRVYMGTLLQEAAGKPWYILCTWVKRWDQELQSLGLLPQMVFFRGKFARDKRIESSIENNRIALHSSGSAVFPRHARGCTTAVKTVKRKHKNKKKPLGPWVYGNLLNLNRLAKLKVELCSCMLSGCSSLLVTCHWWACPHPPTALPANGCQHWLSTQHTHLHVDNVDHRRPIILILILSLHVLLHNLPSLVKLYGKGEDSTKCVDLFG